MADERSIVLRRANAARHLEQVLEPRGAEADDLADGLGRAFACLALGFRQLRAENELLRDENAELRAGLRDCVEACGEYLFPMLDEDEEHARARAALEDARRLLDRPVPLSPVR